MPRRRWYSAIHTPPGGQQRIFHEAARVLRPGGHLLVGFQAGSGVRDLSAGYSRFGHDVQLMRYLYSVDEVSSLPQDSGLDEAARLVRRAEGNERDDQAVLLARKP